MSSTRKSFSERVSKFGSTISFRKTRQTADGTPEKKIGTPEKQVPEIVSAPLPSDDAGDLGLLGADLEQKGELVGSNLVALFTESLYQDHDLRAPSKSNKPTAVSAEAMIREAFGSNENPMSAQSLEPAMIALVKGIMTSMHGERAKVDMEHYAQRRAAQSISQATASLQKKGEDMGNMALESVAKKVHNSKPVPDESIAGTSIGLPTVVEGKGDITDEVPHVQASMTPFTSTEEDSALCIDPELCGVKPQKLPAKKTSRSFQNGDIQEEEDEEDPDLVSMVLSPLITGFNKAFAASSGVAKRVFSALSVDNIRDGLKCFLYDQYLAVLEQEAMVAKLRGLGTSAANIMLEYLANLDEDLDESKEASNDAAVVHSAAGNDSCEDRDLLPPLLEPVMAGILEVVKSSRPLRGTGVFSVARWLCWRQEGGRQEGGGEAA